MKWQKEIALREEEARSATRRREKAAIIKELRESDTN